MFRDVGFWTDILHASENSPDFLNASYNGQQIAHACYIGSLKLGGRANFEINSTRSI